MAFRLVQRNHRVHISLADESKFGRAQRLFENWKDIVLCDRLRGFKCHRALDLRVDRIVQAQNIAKNCFCDFMDVGVREIEGDIIRLQGGSSGQTRSCRELLRARIHCGTAGRRLGLPGWRLWLRIRRPRRLPGRILGDRHACEQ